MSGRKGNAKVANWGEAENPPAEVISHRERRRSLFAKGWEKEDATSPADLISHRDYRRRMSSEKGRETDDEEDERHPEATVMDESSWMTVSEYRREWDVYWSGTYGAFEDTTRIPSMRFTNNPVTDYSLLPRTTLQIFSVKLAATRGSLLHQPLDVFGMVAVRDSIDHNRNIIFQRSREDCQTLTIEDPYLALTGPTRGVMFIASCPVVIEVDLKIKGTNNSADECLSFRVAPVVCFKTLYSHLLDYHLTSELSTLQFKLGHIGSSVEATVVVQVTNGSWPDGLRGTFAAFTTGIFDKYTDGVFLDKRIISIGHEEIVLLDSRGEKMPITGDGQIKLSRRVVSVETSGKLIFRVMEGDKAVVKERTFDPLEAGFSTGELEFSFCTMEVTVFWSLLSDY